MRRCLTRASSRRARSRLTRRRGSLAVAGAARAGPRRFYSYRWLENLAGCRMPNVREIHPDWQDRRVGKTVPPHPSAGLKLLRFDAGRALALERWYLAL